MNQEQVLAWAREAGMAMGFTQGIAVMNYENLERFAALVSETERKVCAQMCENERERLFECGYGLQVITADKLAVAIRARGNQE